MSNELRKMLEEGDRGVKLQLRRSESALRDHRPMFEVLLDWAVYMVVTRNLSRHTVCRYLAGATTFVCWITGRKQALDSVGAADVDLWLRELALRRKLNESTRKLYLQAVRGLFGWREMRGHGPSPAKQITAPKTPDRMARRYSEQTLRALFAACNRNSVIGMRDFTLWLFLYATGARREETSLLTIDQLELNSRGGSVRFMGKGAKERMVSFDRVLGDVLLEWLTIRDRLRVTHDRVFVAMDHRTMGGPLSVGAMERRLRTVGKRTGVRGVEWGLHKFRVSFATDLYDQGSDLEAIRRLMGHNSIETTRRYLAISKRMQNHRMPGDRLREVSGQSRGRVPLWLQKRMEEQHDPAQRSPRHGSA